MFKIPKNDSKYHWTNHVIRKMAFYGLSPYRVKRVIRNPKRVEDGVAENTIAVMQPRKIASRSRGRPGTKQEEIWVMYQQRKQIANSKSPIVRDQIQNGSVLKNSLPFAISPKLTVISAWRYPGVSPIGKRIPIPQDILEELKNKGVVSK